MCFGNVLDKVIHQLIDLSNNDINKHGESVNR